MSSGEYVFVAVVAAICGIVVATYFRYRSDAKRQRRLRDAIKRAAEAKQRREESRKTGNGASGIHGH